MIKTGHLQACWLAGWLAAHLLIRKCCTSENNKREETWQHVLIFANRTTPAGCLFYGGQTPPLAQRLGIRGRFASVSRSRQDDSK